MLLVLQYHYIDHQLLHVRFSFLTSPSPGSTENCTKGLTSKLVRAASACHTDTTPTSHTETPTHIETRTHNQCGDTIEKSQAPDDGCVNVRNMLNIEDVKYNLINCDIK